MGLLLDFKPDDMMGMEENLDDPALEAEFAAIVGKKPNAAAKGKKAGKGGHHDSCFFIWNSYHDMNTDCICCSQTLKGRIWNIIT